jgi:aminoglycoside phosphotransferase family enzyme
VPAPLNRFHIPRHTATCHARKYLSVILALIERRSMRSATVTPPSDGPATLADKVAQLRQLCGPGDEAIETHFAWIFLVGNRALKLRKPVRRDSMDYRTVELRRVDSEEDVRLNRRLAPDVYLGTLPLTRRMDGRIVPGDYGEVVDWLVEMRRLDRRWFLDAALERGDATAPMLERVADMLAAFYASAAPAITTNGQLGPRLWAQAAGNARALGTLDALRVPLLVELQRSALGRLDSELDARVAGGCIVEGHGDLRPEHVLLADPPAAIDCLEFDRDLRVLDRAEELCVLELECARIGHAAVGRRLLDACLGRLGDHPSTSLLDFYRSHRAAHRAKLYTWRAAEPDGGPPAQWLARATRYLDTALEAASRAAG